MNAARSNARDLCAALILMLALGMAFGLGGCVYRPNIQQGNLLKVEDVEQVTPGMTRSQVRYLLGTPMISDPFDPQRWDYVYTFKRGRHRHVDRAHFVVRFDGDKVTQVEKLDMPDDVPVARGKPKDAKASGELDTGREPPPLPSIKQPQPEAPRPGGN
jgi:outer membrane protein assembly factor BamE